MTLNIFIGENEDQHTVYKRLEGIIDTQHLADVIFSKSSNNKIGYYLFRDQEKYFKIYVLPKHIALPPLEENGNYTEVIRQFIDYLKTHYYLQKKYSKYSNDTTTVDTLLELSFEHEHALYSVQDDIEELTVHKLEYLLKNIEDFFKAHRSTKRKLISYTSQTIKHRFDLAKNIKEPDKTKIHQKKYEDFIYSEIANIAYSAIKLFMHNKLSLIENKTARQKLSAISIRIQKLLKQSFRADSSKRLSLAVLASNKVYKHFKKKKSFLQLYANILSLFGIERFFDDSNHVDLNRNIKSDAFFLDPSLLYEWYVYDQLQKTPFFATGNYLIHMDKDAGTGITYTIHKEKSNEDIEITSNPDIVIEDKATNHLYIIDAKWKLTEKSSLNDVLKLKRDCEVRNKNHTTFALLIYPDTKEDLFKEYLYNNEASTFSYYIKQVSIKDKHPCFNLDEISESALNFSFADSLISNLEVLTNTTINNLKHLDIESDTMDHILSDHLVDNVQIIHQEIIKQYSKEEILNDSYCQPVKHFLDQYEDILEPECIDFILSTASSMFYFNKHQNHTYDYSLPASGLWKSIEVELNASVIFLIRYISKICNAQTYYEKLPSSNNDYIQTGARTHQRLFLTDSRKIPGRLDNILLGSFPHLLKNINHEKNYDEGKTLKIFTSIYEEFYASSFESIEAWSTPISEFLFNLIDVRNPHSHKDLMSSQKYNDFLKYILENTDFNFTNLMQLKRNILMYIKNH